MAQLGPPASLHEEVQLLVALDELASNVLPVRGEWAEEFRAGYLERHRRAGPVNQLSDITWQPVAGVDVLY